MQSADRERLLILNKLQRFNTYEWKEVRYSNALKSLVGKLGFTDLKINHKLCYLDKGKDHCISTERVMAGFNTFRIKRLLMTLIPYVRL